MMPYTERFDDFEILTLRYTILRNCPLITYSMALNLLPTVHRQNFNTEKICVQILLCERVERASLENFRIIF